MIYTQIKEVKVYRNSAVIRRYGTAALKQGANELILSGMSGSADPDSLRLFFPEGILGTDVQILSLTAAEQALPSRETQAQIEEIESRMATLKTVEELWIKNGDFTEKEAGSMEALESYLQMLPKKLEALRAEKKTCAEKLEALKKLRETQLRQEGMRVVRLTLESSADREAAFEMEYADQAAYWYGAYELHASAQATEIRVISRARIIQNTGEDWKNVKFTLYTGNPTARQEIPSLGKRVLRFRAPAAARAAAASMPMIVADTLDADIAAPKMAMSAAAEEDADTMTGFTLEGARTVISGAAGTVAELKTETVPADIRVVYVPPLDDSAFLAAFIKTADWPLKPSSAKIYLNGNYCGEIYVSPDLTQEKFTLSLGRDEHVSVSRKEIRVKTEDLLLKGQKRKTCEYEIRIGNLKAQPVTVTVWDQIPVSAEKQIVVVCTEKDGAALDEPTGKLTWELTVPGNTTVTKRLAYTVTYPKDKVPNETVIRG